MLANPACGMASPEQIGISNCQPKLNYNSMRKHKLLWSSILLLFQLHLLAQNRTITGKISDANGKPIPGASIVIKNSRTGTSSGPDGTFSLSVSPEAKTLVFSAVGWTPQDIEIGDRTSIMVTMSARDNTLSEVVVTSLGISRDKRSLGYATQQLK